MSWIKNNFNYCLLIIVLIPICLIIGDYCGRKEAYSTAEILYEERSDSTIGVRPYFFMNTPEEGLKAALDYYEVSNTDIVYAQAILETGNFTSKICKEYNNLFGLYDSKKKCYHKFDHWSESVRAYKDYIQNKYNGNQDYYDFLYQIGYAEDSEYIQKLKKLLNK
jgi:hypothetical protein